MGSPVGVVGPRALRALLSLDAFPFRLVDCSRGEADKPWMTGPRGAESSAGKCQSLHALLAALEGEGKEGSKAASAAREATVRFPVGGDVEDGDKGGLVFEEGTVAERATPLLMGIPAEAVAVVLDDDESKARRVADTLAEAAGDSGRRIVVYAKGGGAAPAEAPPPAAFVSRHATKALQMRGRAVVVDLRRPEERERFGAIPGSLSLPVQDVPLALGMSADAFEAAYGFAREDKGGALLILQCRTHRRSHWASVAFEEAGVRSALPGGERHAVLRDGVYGWKLDAVVQRYKGYDGPNHGVPEAEPFDVEAVDESAARTELSELGISLST